MTKILVVKTDFKNDLTTTLDHDNFKIIQKDCAVLVNDLEIMFVRRQDAKDFHTWLTNRMLESEPGVLSGSFDGVEVQFHTIKDKQ